MLNAFLFFVIAVLYSIVGFGGGSGYIAILSFADLAPSELRFIALSCNIVVVSGGTYLFLKQRILSLTKVVPFILTSVPMAFLGGSIALNSSFFFALLAFCLLIAGILMIFRLPDVEEPKPSNHLVNATIGALVGFVSGLVGIGGGIFLAPILYLMKWEKANAIAAASSFFILVNSIAALIGHVSNHHVSVEWKYIVPLLIAVAIGGQIGSRLTINWLSRMHIKRLTAGLVIFASIRLFYNLYC
jgi:uncharacterized protein